MLKCVRISIARSNEAVAWASSAVVHVVAGAIAMWGASQVVGVWESSVPPGQAINLQARLASPAELSEATTTATITRLAESHDDQNLMPSPQKTNIERMTPATEISPSAVEQAESVEVHSTAEMLEVVVEVKRLRLEAPPDPQLAEISKPRSRDAHPAPSVVPDVGLDRTSSPPAVAGANMLPQPLSSNRAPLYPADALREGRQGQPSILVVVSAEGKVVSAEIAKSSGNNSLDAAALEAVKQWRFTPAHRDGRAVEQSLRIPVRFRIES